MSQQDSLFMDDGLSVPPITDPLGKHWEQPSTAEIAIDETHAMMSEKTFDSLLDYTASQPSGVYSGKMWRAQYGASWMLCWFGNPSSPETLWTFYRTIIIA